VNAVDTVAAVRRAQVETRDWTPETWGFVVAEMPKVAMAHRTEREDWATTVCLLRRDWETPVACAQRLALYIQLHAERWDDTPTLATIRTNHLEER
jgi:hypothetical protein